MKTKFSKILGVLVTLATLLSLFASVTPVSAATQAWSVETTPSTTGFVLSSNNAGGVVINDVGLMVYNSDKSAIYATANITKHGTVDYDGPAVFKSVDSGRNWTRVDKFSHSSSTVHSPDNTAASPWIFDIVAPGVNEVYFTDGYNIYTSKDGGTSWTLLTNLYQFSNANGWAQYAGIGDTWNGASPWGTALVVPDSPAGYIVSIDAITSSIGKFVFAGTAGFSGTDVNGAFVCKESEFGMPWDDLGMMTQRAVSFASCNVWDVKIDPTDFAVKQGLFAVVDVDDTSTFITAKYQGNQWNQASLCKDAEILAQNGTGHSHLGNIYHAEVWLPADFNSSLTGGKFQAWVAIASFELFGDVYYWLGGASSTIDLNVSGLDTETEVSDIDGQGGVADARLIVGGYTDSGLSTDNKPLVWYSADKFSWTMTAKAPTGEDSWYDEDVTVLALADYATSGKALVGTGGTDCGVSFTADYGKTFNTISLMNASLTYMDDLAGNLFLATYDNTITNFASIWRFSGGYWERVFSESMLSSGLAVSELFVRSTPTGDAIFAAEVDGTRIWRSLDNGQTWTLQLSDITVAGGSAIYAFAVGSKDKIYVGQTNKIYVSDTNGIVWFAYTPSSTTDIGDVTDIKVASNGHVLAVGDHGYPVRSTNGGTTWSTVKDTAGNVEQLPPGDGYDYYVAFDAYYADVNANVVNVTSEDGGVWQWTFGAVVDDWDDQQIDNQVGVDDGAAIVTGPGGPGSTAEGQGLVYVADQDSEGDGVNRVRGITAMDELLEAPEYVTFDHLWLTASGADNKLWAIGWDSDDSLDYLYTYTDTLNKAGSGVSLVSTQYMGTAIYGFDPGFATGAFAAVVKWNALPNATQYGVYITDDATDAGSLDLFIARDEILGDYAETFNLTYTFAALAPNTTYYVSVWVTDTGKKTALEEVSSFLFDKKPMSFTTAPAVPNWTPNLSPMSGKENVQYTATPFDWDDVVGATGYEFQIAEGNGIPTGTATTTLTASSNTIASLKPATFYTWRVRAMNGTIAGEWITSVFTTVAAPPAVVTVPPATTVTTISTSIVIPTQTPAPVPTINLPQPTVVVNPAPITVTIPPGTTMPVPTLVMPEAQTPVYIWIIVAVGALLTVAVIVLIIRTRRVV